MAQVEVPETVPADAQPPTRPDVFVSYAREDAELVRRLTAALAERGKSAWVDWEDIPPTAEWLAEVDAGIEAADAFVSVISPDSLASEVCALELKHAVEHNKRIVPLLRREAGTVPVPPELEKPNWIFIRDEDDFDAAVETLTTALETDLDWVRAHTRLLTRAIEWRSRDEDRSLLLSGSDLREAESWLAQHDGKKEPAPTALQRQYLLASRRAVSRRQRILLVAVLIALAVTALLAVLALLQRNKAIDQAKTAESRALAASAVAQLPADPELSVLLAAEAAKTAPTTEAEAALRLALPQSLVVAASNAHDEDVNTVEFSPDGRYVLSAAEDGVAVVWDWQAGKQVGRLRVVPPLGSERGAPTTEDRLVARFSPDGSTVLAAGLDKDLLWRWRSNLTTPLAEEGVPYELATFASDDYLVAPVDSVVVGGRQQIRGIALADESSAPDVLGAVDMSDPAYAAFEPENGLFMLADLEGKAAIWDSVTGGVTRLDTLAGAVSEGVERVTLAYDVELSRDGRHLAVAASDGEARVWDWQARRRVVEVGGHSSTVSTVAFSPEGDLLLTASWDGTARIWNWRQRQEVASLRGHRGWVTSAAFSPDGRYVVTGGADGSVRVWAIARERSLESLTAGESELTSIDADEEGRWVLTATLEYASGQAEAARVVNVWDRERAEVVAELRWPPQPFGDYALPIEAEFSRDGSRVAAADGGSVWVWDWMQTAELSPPVAEPGEDFPPLATVEGLSTHVAFSPDGSLVAAAFADGFTRIWRWREGELVAELALQGARKGELPRLPQQTVAFSSDGRYVVVAGKDDRAWVWDWEERTAHELPAGGSARTAVFSPDGELAATAGAEGVVRVYDWRRDRLVADLRHGDGVSDIEFSLDGKLLLSGSRDGTARIWDWEAERSVLDLPDHPSWVTAVAFTAGGKLLVTGGADGVARVFSCSVCGPLEQLEALVPERVTRDLTPEERARYLP